MNRRDFLRGLGLGATALASMSLPDSLLANAAITNDIDGLIIDYSQGTLTITYDGKALGPTVTFDLSGNTISIMDKEGIQIGEPITIITDYKDDPITTTTITISGLTNTQLILGTAKEDEKPANGLIFANGVSVSYALSGSYRDEIKHNAIFNSYIENAIILLGTDAQLGQSDGQGLDLTFATSALEKINPQPSTAQKGVLVFQNHLPVAAILTPITHLLIMDHAIGSNTIDAADFLGAENVVYPLTDETLGPVLTLLSENIDDITSKLKAEATPSP